MTKYSELAKRVNAAGGLVILTNQKEAIENKEINESHTTVLTGDRYKKIRGAFSTVKGTANIVRGCPSLYYSDNNHYKYELEVIQAALSGYLSLISNPKGLYKAEDIEKFKKRIVELGELSASLVESQPVRGSRKK